MKLLFISAGALTLCEKPWIHRNYLSCFNMLSSSAVAFELIGMDKDSYKIVEREDLPIFLSKDNKKTLLIMAIVAIRKKYAHTENKHLP